MQDDVLRRTAALHPLLLGKKERSKTTPNISPEWIVRSSLLLFFKFYFKDSDPLKVCWRFLCRDRGKKEPIQKLDAESCSLPWPPVLKCTAGRVLSSPSL